MQKEYKTGHDWVEKVINWEFCKKFKFDHTNKRHMHNPESITENETHKILWDFEIQMDHLISTRRTELVLKKERENLVDRELCHAGWSQGKSERKRKER